MQSLAILIAIVRGARPGLIAAPAQGGPPHAPWVVGAIHLSGSWWRWGGTTDQIRQSCWVGCCWKRIQGWICTCWPNRATKWCGCRPGIAGVSQEWLKKKMWKAFNITSGRKNSSKNRLKNLTAVGAVGEPELLGQECRESLLGMSQGEEGKWVNSGQLCWGSNDFGAFIPLKTATHTNKFVMH